MLSKKNILVFCSISTLLFLFLVFLGTDACYVSQACRELRQTILHDSFVVTAFFPAMLFFSLITYKMRDEVFRAWVRFSYWWVPLSFVLILVSSDEPGHLAPSLQEMVAMLTWGLYVVVSIIIIAWKYFATRPVK